LSQQLLINFLICIIDLLTFVSGGGYPRGRVIEIFGPESSGKTTLALHAVAEVQRAGGISPASNAVKKRIQNYIPLLLN
jgi:RecA/RadA recombinase